MQLFQMFAITLSLSTFNCDVIDEAAIHSPLIIRYASGYRDDFLATKVKENDTEQPRLQYESTETVKLAETSSPATEQSSIVPERHKEEPFSSENSSSFSDEEEILNRSNSEQKPESAEVFTAAQNNTQHADSADLHPPHHQETVHMNVPSLSHDTKSQRGTSHVEDHLEVVPSHMAASPHSDDEAASEVESDLNEKPTEQITTHRETTEQLVLTRPFEIGAREEVNQHHIPHDDPPPQLTTTLPSKPPPSWTNTLPTRYPTPTRPSTTPSHDRSRHGMKYEQNFSPVPTVARRHKEHTRQQSIPKKTSPHRYVYQERDVSVPDEPINTAPRRMSARRKGPSHSVVQETSNPPVRHQKKQENRQQHGRRQRYRSSIESSPEQKPEYRVNRRNKQRENPNTNSNTHEQYEERNESIELEEQNIPAQIKGRNLNGVNVNNFPRKSHGKKPEEFAADPPVDSSPISERNERPDSRFVMEKTENHRQEVTQIEHNRGHNGVEEATLENTHIKPDLNNQDISQSVMDQNYRFTQNHNRPQFRPIHEKNSPPLTDPLVLQPKLNQDALPPPNFRDTYSSTTEKNTYPVEADYDENLYYKSYAPPPNKSLYAILFDVLGNQVSPGKKENSLPTINNNKESQTLYDVSPKSFVNSPNRDFEPNVYKTREGQDQLYPKSKTEALNNNDSNRDEISKFGLGLSETENEPKRTITEKHKFLDNVSPKPENLSQFNAVSENEPVEKYIKNRDQDVSTEGSLQNEDSGYVVYHPPDDKPKYLKTTNSDDESLYHINQQIKTKSQEHDERTLNVQNHSLPRTDIIDYTDKKVVSKSSNNLEESSGEHLLDPRMNQENSQEAPTHKDNFESNGRLYRGNGRRINRLHAKKRRPETLEVAPTTPSPETDDCPMHHRRRGHNCRGRGNKRANSSSRRHSDDNQRYNSPRGISRHHHQSLPIDHSENGADVYSNDENIRVKVILPREESRWDEMDDTSWDNGGSPEDIFEHLPTWESFRIVPKVHFSEAHVHEEEEPEQIPLRPQPPPITNGWRSRQRSPERPVSPPHPISAEEDVLPARKRSGKRSRTHTKSHRNDAPGEKMLPLRRRPDTPSSEEERVRGADTHKEEIGESDPEKRQENNLKVPAISNEKRYSKGNRHDHEMDEELHSINDEKKDFKDIEKPIKIKEIRSENIAYDEYYRPYQLHGQRGLYSFDIYQPYAKINREGFDSPDRRDFLEPKYRNGLHDDEGTIKHRNMLTDERPKSQPSERNFGEESDGKGDAESRNALLAEEKKFLCKSGKCDAGERLSRHGNEEGSDGYSSGPRYLPAAARRPDLDIHGWRPFDDWD